MPYEMIIIVIICRIFRHENKIANIIYAFNNRCLQEINEKMTISMDYPLSLIIHYHPILLIHTVYTVYSCTLTSRYIVYARRLLLLPCRLVRSKDVHEIRATDFINISRARASLQKCCVQQQETHRHTHTVKMVNWFIRNVHPAALMCTKHKSKRSRVGYF